MHVVASLRASDSDREQVAERLRHAMAEGRLSGDELEQRLEALYAARTYGELDALLADLPTTRSRGGQRVRVARWAAAVGALTLVLAAVGALAIARLHSASAVAGPGGGRQLRFPAPPLRQFGFRPAFADPNHSLIVAVSTVGAFAVLLVCGILLWALLQSRGRVGRLSRPTSRFD